MLRFIVLALVLINSVYFAWSHGLLQAYGFAPLQQTEPQRLDRQIRPKALQVLTEKELLSLAGPAPRLVPKPAECLQAGVFDEAQSARLRSALESADLPAGSWLLEAAVEPARWIVYMGKYPNAEALAKKRSELAALNLKLEPLTNPTLRLGLSLGRFETPAAAQVALVALTRRGVRTAQVVLEQAEVSGTLLRVPAADEILRVKLDQLTPVLAGKVLSPCS